MTTTINAIFDGEVFRPEKPIDLPPGTRVVLTIEPQEKPSSTKKSRGFLDVAHETKLSGPPDWSENLDDYLYGRKPFPDE